MNFYAGQAVVTHHFPAGQAATPSRSIKGIASWQALFLSLEGPRRPYLRSKYSNHHLPPKTDTIVKKLCQVSSVPVFI